jgi:hypothetical protein
LARKPEEKGPLEKPRLRCEYNIKKDLKEIGWGVGLDSSGSEQGQVASCYEHGSERAGSMQCGEFLDYLRN